MSHKISPLLSVCTASSPSCRVMNMLWLLCLLSLLSSTESMELLSLHNPTTGLNHVGIQVESHHLNSVSTSILMAESWLRTHVLSLYPSTNISTIVVGNPLLCNKNEENKLDTLILPSIKNIHHSLIRWGLQNPIKVTSPFSPKCLDSNYLKPLLTTLQKIASPYVFSDLKPLENIGLSHLNTTIMVLNSNPLKRKLSFIDISRSKIPFPPSPKPSPVFPPSNPAYAVGTPLPPLIGTVTPPPSDSPAYTKSPPFVPHLAPLSPHLPPCEPAAGRGRHGLWCVAKPSVPAETLQEALDYACGEGSADCEAIQSETGSCRYPDTVVAHASYAFNSYWQRTKRNGGTCGFGGTAMLISSDPSYGHCRFIIS